MLNVTTGFSGYVVIYVRVSTAEQAKGGESLDNQERKCKEFAEKSGYIVIRVFREEGESGGTADRTQLKELLKFCHDKNNNVSAVICYKVDRLSRNVGDFAYLSRHLRKEGVRILFTNGMNVDNALGKFILNLEAAIGELELGMITERINNGVRAAKNSGRYYHKKFGYDVRTNNLTGKKQLYLNADTPTVKKIFELLDDNYNQTQVRELMKKDGVDIPPQTFEKLIKRIQYCGLTLNAEGQQIKGIHEPIVSEELFWSVQRKLNGRERDNKIRVDDHPIFTLRRYIYCHANNHKMTPSLAKGRFPYYHCQGNKRCRYRKQDVDAAYLNYLRTLKPKEEHLEMFRQMSMDIYEQKTTNITEQNKRLKAEILELEKQQLGTLLLMRDKEDITIKKLGEKEVDILEAQIQEKKACLMDEEKINKITEDCWDFVKFFMNNVDAIWETGNLEIKKDVQSLISPKGFVF